MAALDNAKGVIIERSGDGTPTGVFTDAGDIIEFQGGSRSRTMIETTTHKSSGGWRTYAGGLKTPNRISIDLPYDEALYAAWDADLNAAAAGYYRVTFPVTPDPVEWEFYAKVEEIAEATPLDDRAMITVTLQLSGPSVRAIDAGP